MTIISTGGADLAVGRAMLQIKAMDNSAVLAFSEYTGKWYVSARIEVGGDGLLSGFTEHRREPEEAVFAYLNALKSVGPGKFLVVNAYRDTRREYMWTGFAFKEMALSHD